MGQRISPNGYVTANLTSTAEAESRGDSLRSGESIAYQGADGQSCKVSLLASDAAGSGTASFAVACS